MSKGFLHSVAIRWGDCDAAGIVYFPKYFDYFHQTMEAFFDEALGIPYREMIQGRKLGFPAVHTEADFSKPSSFGEVVDITIEVLRIGRTSIEFGYTICGEGQPTDVRVRGRTVCVVMNLDASSPAFRQSVPFPDDLRTLIETRLGTPG